MLNGQAEETVRRAESAFKDPNSPTQCHDDALQALVKRDYQLEERTRLAELEAGAAIPPPYTAAILNYAKHHSSKVAEEAGAL